MKVEPLLHCHVLLQGMQPEWAAEVPRLPGLEGLLALTASRQDFSGEAIAWLCAGGGKLAESLPAAPLSALGDALPATQGYWLRVDPVHLHLLRDSLVLADCSPFGLAADEAEALVATLNRHFVADGLQFVAPAPDRWYLQLAEPLALTTHVPAVAIGGDADAWLPRGADAMRWHGWINEAQMLLHEHAVNAAREERGQLPVNSIWPWGGGELPASVASPFHSVCADNVLARGLALAQGCVVQPLPAKAEEWQARISQPGAHLVVLDQLDTSAARQTPIRWQQTLQDLDARWLEPLLQRWKAGKLAGLHLHLAGMRKVASLTPQRSRRWQFWRKPPTLESLLHG